MEGVVDHIEALVHVYDGAGGENLLERLKVLDLMGSQKQIAIFDGEVALELLTIFKALQKLLVLLLHLVIEFNRYLFNVFCEGVLAVFVCIVRRLRRDNIQNKGNLPLVNHVISILQNIVLIPLKPIHSHNDFIRQF